jgi:hypothetical protein
MYELCVFQYAAGPDYTLKTDCEGAVYCTNCPVDTCLINCGPDAGLDDLENPTACEPCLPDCEMCIEAGRCGQCEDPLCDSCEPDYATCEACKDSASIDLVTGDCTCDSGSAVASAECLPCAPDCATCTTPGDSDSCGECSPSAVLSNGKCMTKCPVGT